MQERDAQTDAIALLPLTAVLWLGYLLALLSIDLLFYPSPIFPPWYYLINGFDAAVILGLALWPRGRAWLGRGLLPLAIVLLSVVPVLMAQAVNMAQQAGPAGAPASVQVSRPASAATNGPPGGPPGRPPPAGMPEVARSVSAGAPPSDGNTNGPASGPEALLLRTMPLLLMALILTAWQYGWRYVIVFSGGIAFLTLGLHLYFYRPGGPSLLPPVTVVVIQTISFLVVGYFISVLIGRLKQQQAALVQVNAQLADHAATLEELTVSRERNRMARELHDTLAHTLSALSVQLETVRAYWEVDPPAARAMLDNALTATRSGLHETRRALKSLRASPLEDLGLLLALRQLAGETAERANLALRLAVPEQLPAMPPAVEQCIYRVAQEAVANVAHHANARTLTVQLAVGHKTVLRIADDGAGFAVHDAMPAGHFGLSGMRERAHLVGGELTITSQPGAGTEVLLELPMGTE